MGIAQDIVALFQKRVQEHGSLIKAAKCLGVNRNSLGSWKNGRYLNFVVLDAVDRAGGKLKIGKPAKVGTFKNAILALFQSCFAEHGRNYQQTAKYLGIGRATIRYLVDGTTKSLSSPFFPTVDKCGGYLTLSGTGNLPDPEIPKHKVVSKPKIPKHKVSKLATKPKVSAKEESPNKLAILSQLRDEYLAANGNPSWLKKPSRRAKQRIETEIDPDWDRQNECVEWNF